MSNITHFQSLIYEIRGIKVMLDSDLAGLYGIETFRLNEAVKRNSTRFPSDFMFQLTSIEWENLISQIAISSCNLMTQPAISKENLKSQIATSSWGGRRKLPFVFTEQGVAMLSSVLNSPRAIEVNIAIMRAFVQMRHFVQHRPMLADEIKELKQMLLLHIDNTKAGLDEHTDQINQIIEVLNNLIEQPPPKRKIGFHRDEC